MSLDGIHDMYVTEGTVYSEKFADFVLLPVSKLQLPQLTFCCDYGLAQLKSTRG